MSGCQARPQESGTRRAAGKAFFLSAVVPGAGQYYLGQRRWPLYVGAEALGWALFFVQRSDGSNLREAYRDLAWDVARTYDGPRVDGDFAYYESLTKYERSGAFDTDPSRAGIQPETDLTTFNGQAWLLAIEIFFGPDADPRPGDPGYDQALGFYRDRAAAVEFAWDWSGQPGEQARYGRLIDDSDTAFRRASLFVGIVAANHLLSAIDAFVSARARAFSGLPIRLQTLLLPDGRGTPALGIGLHLDLR
jgi:hypothetical protein